MLVLCILAHKGMKWNHVWNHDWWVSCFHHSFWIPSLHASLKRTTKTQLLCFFIFPWWTFNKFTSNWSQTSSIHSATCAPVTAKSGTRSRSINAFWLPAARNLTVKTEFAIHVHEKIWKKCWKHMMKIQTGMCVVLKACDQIWEPKHAQKNDVFRTKDKSVYKQISKLKWEQKYPCQATPQLKSKRKWPSNFRWRSPLAMDTAATAHGVAPCRNVVRQCSEPWQCFLWFFIIRLGVMCVYHRFLQLYCTCLFLEHWAHMIYGCCQITFWPEISILNLEYPDSKPL